MVRPRVEQIIEDLSWEDFGKELQILKGKVKKTYTGIYGVPRGGLAIAIYLSNHLNIPMLKNPKDGCLIVDDIADSGKTLCELMQRYKLHNITIATLHYKNKSIILPDHYVKIIKEKTWIRYPWER